MVLLPTPILQLDKDTKIVRPRNHPYTGSSKFCANLVVSSSNDSFLGAINVERRNRWMMGSLLGKIRNCDFVMFASRAGCAARWCAVRIVLHGRGGVVDYPIALPPVSPRIRGYSGASYPEKFAKRRIVWFAWLSFDIFLPQVRIAAWDNK